MSSAEDWATAALCADILRRGHHRVESIDEPILLVQRLARNPILCGGPAEYFSQDMPVWHPKPPDDDSLRPIDVLYGRYEPKTREIEIFVNSIKRDAHIYDAEPNELREIVRIHEHAHAVVHLGSRADDVYKQLSTSSQSKRTEWAEFINRRTSWFAEFPNEIHEFIAQALTHAALQKLSVKRKSERLRQVFDALELKQPPHYRLPSGVKLSGLKSDWALIFEVARGTFNVYREKDVTLRSGLEALICSVGE